MATHVSRGNGWRFADRVRQITVANDPANASDMRSFVGGFLTNEQVPTHIVDEVLMAVGEVVANACRHGRRIGQEGEVVLRCELKDEGIVVMVEDDGPGFDVRALEVGAPDVFSQGGRGFFLMRQLMDRVDVQSTDRGTTVVLSRAIHR